MREIKFRAWDKLNSKMQNWEELRGYCDIDHLFGGFYERGTGHPYNYPIAMQFTGLKDKNGKEVYEGDIVRTWEENEPIPVRDDGGGIIDYDHVEGYLQLGVVEFKDGWFAYSTKKHLGGRKEQIYAPICFTENIEIIGNIHENPELLEVQ